MGALLTLYQIVKKYEFKKPEERQVLHSIMQVLLPQLYARFMSAMEDSSQLSLEIQKQILKIFFALIQYVLPMELITSDSFGKWMQVFQSVVNREVPQFALEGDEEELAKLPWWKAKKWALHILCRVFERISNSLHWKIMRPHIQAIIQEVVFPLMCYTEEDDELWQEDPYEFIRVKYGKEGISERRAAGSSAEGWCSSHDWNTSRCVTEEDNDPPVIVEAAIALQFLIEKTRRMGDAETHLNIWTSKNKWRAIAIDIARDLAATFVQLLDGDDSDEKAVTAMGILNTLETMLNVMEGSKEEVRSIVSDGDDWTPNTGLPGFCEKAGYPVFVFLYTVVL
ncbi:importin-7 [Desmophyllum pertusum]|uniref:Importin-7 n=1 Tax=Desmophyllum pertusum TaxID=174260 RepID=A0A9W9Z0I2_9CNID|nr:importin-7 [Desmophyllum pertusum]